MPPTSFGYEVDEADDNEVFHSPPKPQVMLLASYLLRQSHVIDKTTKYA